jgi:hypothetical protein
LADGKKHRVNTDGLRPPWKPGESGNPAGRTPNVKTIPEILRKIGEEEGTKVSVEDGGATKLDVVMQQVYKFAREGKSWAVQFIAERTEGKVTDTHEIVGQVPIAMEVIVTKKKADEPD